MNDGESAESTPTCWVCLCGDEVGEPLETPCQCLNRPVHAKCLARWQLQSAGKLEERECRFCNAALPDWKAALTPSHLRSATATPVVSVHYNGTCFRIKVKPGAEGFAQFQRQLHKITGLPPHLEGMAITFQCRAPGSAQELSFKGIGAFDAAIHCASVSAAERRQRAAHQAAPGTAASSRHSVDCPPPASPATTLPPLAAARRRQGLLSTPQRGASLDSARPPLVYRGAPGGAPAPGSSYAVDSEGEEELAYPEQGDNDIECEEVEVVSPAARGHSPRTKARTLSYVRDMFRRLLASSRSNR